MSRCFYNISRIFFKNMAHKAALRLFSRLKCKAKNLLSRRAGSRKQKTARSGAGGGGAQLPEQTGAADLPPQNEQGAGAAADGDGRRLNTNKPQKRCHIKALKCFYMYQVEENRRVPKEAEKTAAKKRPKNGKRTKRRQKQNRTAAGGRARGAQRAEEERAGAPGDERAERRTAGAEASDKPRSRGGRAGTTSTTAGHCSEQTSNPPGLPVLRVRERKSPAGARRSFRARPTATSEEQPGGGARRGAAEEPGAPARFPEQRRGGARPPSRFLRYKMRKNAQKCAKKASLNIFHNLLIYSKWIYLGFSLCI